ncbi:MAG: formate dehydrogenase accessory sulfurtransferase FdhD [Proteobacteria bacterium]|nr:formate dehydrogenase accessory sulfurtransferase FdhD [Pseudomonadota bacterium]
MRWRYKDAMEATKKTTPEQPASRLISPQAAEISEPILLDADGANHAIERSLAREMPISITYNGAAHAVMMASPQNLEDFGVGFSLSERIVDSAAEISAIVDDETGAGLLLHMEIPPHRLDALKDRRRSLVGSSSCGLCGVTNLEDAVRRYAPIATPPALSTRALFAAMEALPNHQPLNRETGAVHGAAFANSDGAIMAVREDVGRHNAFDKLIGHMARQDIRPESGFAILTSRCSIELVQKALAARIPALVAISAPTGLAVALAREHRLTLIALAREDNMLCFNDPYGLFA